MKNIIATIFIALLTYSIYAQVPGIGQIPFGMKYQAVARNAQGQPINSEAIGLRFSILRDSENGTVVYTEERLVNTNDLGLFVVTIGSINLTEFSNLDWRIGDHFLKVELNDNGTWINLGTHQLLSVPYAVTAGNGKQVNEAGQDNMSFYGANGNINITLSSQNTFDNGQIILHDDQGEIRAVMRSNGNAGSGEGNLNLAGENGNLNVTLNAFQNANNGRVSIHDENGTERGRFFSWLGANGAGNLDVMGENNSFNVRIGPVQSSVNFGTVAVRDDSGAEKGNFFSHPTQGGAATIHLEGANDNFNVTMGSTSTSNGNHGIIQVRDASGAVKALMGVNDSGQGVMTVNGIKPFHMNHPKDSKKQIWYCAIEGPEAAAYERGTAQLVSGEARVDFSEHFELVVNPTTVTVTLTPLDAASKGLAVVEKTATGFIVKELGGGTGNYSFDWRVEGVRKGYEDFEVIRDKAEMERMMGLDTEEK